ncbi:putative phosphatase regulatory subunit-domain-containing protein [Naematelia encephala]|uniref:Putative phosphatase regulatory subunit-domain-containing protein n=1 Tax=Naematelia encephala TaxID=71784 RepID=A0A1Y2AHI0_9TREE|nr:putative phosphatase regulatory subunit-domain-containing protein [Naematelia encephala]
MTTDSLQIAQRRGRRPRLFGFTELPESSGSSASSSRDGSRANSPATSQNNSPERARTGSPLTAPSMSASSSTPVAGPASSAPGNFIPRRHPVRARSETNLMTLSSSSNPVLPRRRDNGLKLDFAGIIPATNQQEMEAAVVPSPYSATLIRKKSGEILKPALKYIGRLGPNGTPVGEETPQPRTRFESKSLPSTPSCPKYVHFDAQLERVKLFLHDQKPQVVSRGGSPKAEYTTSEGEEFPFPSTDEERDDQKVLQIKLPNFPTSPPPDADLYLESLYLDDDRRSLRGITVCKNLAFQKWVAVRFTFDWWQTTSEVTAIHKDSIKGGAYDRFSFQIKLHDMIAKIEQKTLFMAIRYTTDGREIWDSNGGQNYQVLFEKVAGESRAQTLAKRSVQNRIAQGMGKAVGGKASQWSVTGGAQDDDRMADLRAKLSRLTGDDLGASPPQLSPGGANRPSFAFSPRKNAAFAPSASSPTRSFSAIEPAKSDLPSAGPALAARYDFGASLRTTKERRSSNSPNLQSTDLPQVRTGLLNYKRNDGHAATEFYSPRFSPNMQSDSLPVPNGGGGDYFFAPPSTSPASMNSPNVAQGLTVPDLQVQEPSPPAIEDHSTGLSFGVAASSSTPSGGQTTPTTSERQATESPSTSNRSTPLPQRRPSVSRAHSSPPAITRFLAASASSSKESSPPSLDPSGPGSASETPSDSPKSPPDVSLPKWSPTSPLDMNVDGPASADSLASYSSFIEQFCWGGAPPSAIHADIALKRSHSTSSLDTYFISSAHGESGHATPRATSPFAVATPMSSSSSTSSYYTSYSRQSTPQREHGRDEIDSVEDGLGGFTSLLGRISPSSTVAC